MCVLCTCVIIIIVLVIVHVSMYACVCGGTCVDTYT